MRIKASNGLSKNVFKKVSGKDVKPSSQEVSWTKRPNQYSQDSKKISRHLYEAVDISSVKTVKNHLMNKSEKSAPKAMRLWGEGFDNITDVLSLPLNAERSSRLPMV